MPVVKKPSSTSKTAAEPKRTPSVVREKVLAEEKTRRQRFSIFLFALGVLLIVFSLVGNVHAETPNVTDSIKSFLYGMFGVSVFLTGPVAIYIAVNLSREHAAAPIRLWQLAFYMALVSGAAHIFLGKADFTKVEGFKETVALAFSLGKEVVGGGVYGLILGVPLMLFGKIVAGVIIVLMLFVTLTFSLQITLSDVIDVFKKPFGHFKNRAAEGIERGAARREILREERREQLEREHREKLTHKATREEINAVHKQVARFETLSPTKPTEEGADLREKIRRADDLVRPTPVFTDNTPIQSQPIQSEPTQSEPIQSEPTQSEPTQSEPTQSEPTPAEPIQKRVIPPFFPIEPTVPAVPAVPTAPQEIPPDLPFDLAEEENPVTQAVQALQDEKAEEEKARKELEQKLLAAEEPQPEEVKLPTESPLSNDQTDKTDRTFEAERDIAALLSRYTLPPTLLLNDVIITRQPDEIEQELALNSDKLVETLKSFGVMTKVIGVCRGPSVTRYEVQPAAGVQISKITRLVDDIALSFAAAGVRIEAPIPGKAAVGVEVPNRHTDTVPFRSLIESPLFGATKSKLGAAIGVDITGQTIVADIAKMPHILIAGTTGSGKSVCVNSIIMSILFRSVPNEVRLLMIDPKAVEFMIYNGIPHLLIPVVTDPKKAAGALGWAVTEMLARYKLFAENNVRDLAGYNAHLKKHAPDKEPLPQIVIFIDELADLMMAAPGEVEDSICRLAQMARAAGMHLVIATQRPSVNVVTGVIKANIPSRIALKVASQVDSRTIIDSAGAEKLLGKGDMLYFPVGAPKPIRVQGCWVSEKEVDRVVEFIKNSFTLSYDTSVIEEIERQAEQAELSGGKKKKQSDDDDFGEVDGGDERLEDAIDAVLEAGQASTSYLQRKLKLGYGRAARLIDLMEEMGVVGEFEGSKPRQVIMTRQEWLERKMNKS
ncbi:MAG: DNA translocase FtsK [Oscillospiraceae bacterium]|jgi:S-DNA-T family DNA segregation ATPase FtsK/SpoIIIE|nr:DNA translocase FtsK [Oscillospiraceae bacterium]